MSRSFTLELIETAEPYGADTLRIRGSIGLAEAAEFSRQLQGASRPDHGLVVDLSGVERLDGACAALLVSFEAESLCSNDLFTIEGASPGVARLLELYAIEGNPCKPPPRHKSMLVHIGEGAASVGREATGVLAFVGELASSTVRAFRNPRSVHWADLGPLLERAGADSVPIVVAINLLVGFILGLQSALQMEQFGVGIYVADLVGKSVVRELGPLMTAIIVTGRSGAAYAAQIGTMVVSEEVSALRSMRFDPVRFLVLPRVITLVVMVPMLVIIANSVGLFGGLLVGVGTLDLTVVEYVQRTQEVLDLSDWLGGLAKSAAFGAAIALIACQRGFSTRGGAEGVGTSTTSAVVTTLFVLVVLDAFFTIIFSALKI